MAKVGRNDPCPCGSGKKHKKCHGSLPDTTAARRFYPVAQEATIPAKLPPTISAQLPPQGLAGIQQALVVVPVFTDPKDPRNQGGPQGRPGAYEVIFTLCRPGFPLTQNEKLDLPMVSAETLTSLSPSPRSRHQIQVRIALRYAP